MGPQGHIFYTPGQSAVVHGVASAVGVPPPIAAVPPVVAAPGTWGGEVQIPLTAGPPTPPKPAPAYPPPN
eukprot:10117774-Heterocapsa_arctica.AAC.1